MTPIRKVSVPAEQTEVTRTATENITTNVSNTFPFIFNCFILSSPFLDHI